MNKKICAYLYAGFVALFGATLSGAVAWGTLPATATTKEIIVVCIVPAGFIFYAWLQNPKMPWDGVDRRGVPAPTPKERIPV